MVKTFVLTDESINSYGFWLPMSGAQIEQFKANPIMLWMHNRSWRGTADEVLPLGIWVNIRIEKGQLLADAEFDEDDEFARRIAKKVEKGILRMASVGIVALEWSEDPKAMKPGQTRPTVTKWKVREASIVDIGSNDNALAFYDEAGNALNLGQETADYCPIPLLGSALEENQKTQFTMKEVLSELNLAEGSTELQAKEAIVTLKNKVTTAEAAQEAAEKELADYKKKDGEAKKQEAVDLTDAAIKDGRIDAKARESVLSLFEKNHEAAKVSLASIPKRTSIADKVGSEGEDESKKFAAMSWADLDKANMLADLKANNWELYAEKFKAKFGLEPKK